MLADIIINTGCTGRIQVFIYVYTVVVINRPLYTANHFARLVFIKFIAYPPRPPVPRGLRRVRSPPSAKPFSALMLTTTVFGFEGLLDGPKRDKPFYTVYSRAYRTRMHLNGLCKNCYWSPSPHRSVAGPLAAADNTNRRDLWIPTRYGRYTYAVSCRPWPSAVTVKSIGTFGDKLEFEVLVRPIRFRIIPFWTEIQTFVLYGLNFVLNAYVF